MPVKQISVFLENKIGRLAEITKVLGERGINIRALAIADTTEFGILRMIVDRPDDTLEALEERDFAVRETNVIVLRVSDKPGGLARILSVLKESSLNVEYLYAFVKQSGEDAFVVFRIEDTEEALKELKEAGVQTLEADQVYRM